MLCRVIAVGLCVSGIGGARLGADDEKKQAAQSVQQIAAVARKAVVVVRHTGRDGKEQGLGTGFVVAADGLVVTNFHVVGEARPVSVETADGKRFQVSAVHAFDRTLDLAILKIDAKDLPALQLGDSAAAKEGQAIVALGNPFGLKHSVVSGVVSGKRELEGRTMLQVAIPIEPGNSGGPVLDAQGRVLGIVTIKSLVTANLGFAVAVDHVKPLLKKPNPVPMSRWLTIGSLDAREWQQLGGVRWRQRAGHIVVDGQGEGFGGRTLCLARRPLPDLPYEVAVSVRLGDETGAAGLVFHADGGDKHYGFYPSAGQMRLSRFEGPDVFTWKVLYQQPSPHYRPGEWNALKVRVEKDKIRCYVNDQLVLESTDDALPPGTVGLAKFRDTRAEFKHFQVAKQIPPLSIAPEISARIRKSVDGPSSKLDINDKLLDSLTREGSAPEVLRDRAKELEEQAGQLRRLAGNVHQRRVQEQLVAALKGKEEGLDLLRAALLVARLDNEDLDPEVYCREVDRMARDVARALPRAADEKAKLAGLSKYLFADNGFHGSRGDYYHRSNSYLNEVIDDREGLPITLSVLYIELARRLGLNVAGVGLPGHFVVKHIPARGESHLIDVYEGGVALSREDADKRIQAYVERPPKEEDYAPMDKRAIVVRMLHNLLGIAQRDKDLEAMLRYLDVIVAVAPDAGPERAMRAVVRAQMGFHQKALADVDWLLEHKPPGLDLEKVEELRQRLQGAGR